MERGQMYGSPEIELVSAGTTREALVVAVPEIRRKRPAFLGLHQNVWGKCGCFVGCWCVFQETIAGHKKRVEVDLGIQEEDWFLFSVPSG
jgi:hypothetical protein